MCHGKTPETPARDSVQLGPVDFSSEPVVAIPSDRARERWIELSASRVGDELVEDLVPSDRGVEGSSPGVVMPESVVFGVMRGEWPEHVDWVEVAITDSWSMSRASVEIAASERERR